MHTHHEVNFSTDVEGLEEAKSPEVIRLRDGETHEIKIKPVRKRINDAEVRMLGYNGSIPGPTLHVDQDSEVTIEATNLGDVDATLHWHGLRLENRFDGVPEETQAPIPHGGHIHLPTPVPRPGLLLVPPAHPRGLRPGDGPLRRDHRRALGSGLLAAGRPPAGDHA